jgi:hypothetical protein
MEMGHDASDISWKVISPGSLPPALLIKGAPFLAPWERAASYVPPTGGEQNQSCDG